MARGDRREEIFRDERGDGTLWAISLKARSAPGSKWIVMSSWRISSNSVAQTIRRTKTHDAQTLKVLKHQIILSKRLTPSGLPSATGNHETRRMALTRLVAVPPGREPLANSIAIGMRIALFILVPLA
jgi:hypothetical protein